MDKRDEELFEQAANMKLVYCDGFGAFRMVNGMLRAVGYILHGADVQTAVVNLGVSPMGAEEAQMETQRTLKEGLAREIQYWQGYRAHH